MRLLIGLALVLAGVVTVNVPRQAAVAQNDSAGGSPPAAPAGESLLAVTLPLESLPITMVTGPWTLFFYSVLAPESTTTFPGVRHDGGDVHCVVTGSLFVSADDGDAGVLRGADRHARSAEEPLTAGKSAALARGDCLRVPLAVTFTLRNSGPDEVELLDAFTWRRLPPRGDALSIAKELGWVDFAGWVTAAVPLLTVRFDRVVLQPGEALAPSPGTQLAVAPEGDLDAFALGGSDNGGVFNNVDRAVPVLVVVVAPADERTIESTSAAAATPDS